MLKEYFHLLVFVGLGGLLSVVMVFLSVLLVMRETDVEKVSAYECGFHPFQDTRTKFDVRFYLVAILFIIFDLEITFLFPWCVKIGILGSLGFWSMMVFLWILVVGFFYEWKKGALDWE
jgi:NADH-quinone oxidoreductase subunit A